MTNGLSKSAAGFSSLGIANFSIGLGTRLKVPDDNFVYSATLNLQRLKLNNWNRGDFRVEGEGALEDGKFFNFNVRQTLARTTVVDPIYPKTGSKVSLTLQLTPPYSLFNKDRQYADEPAAQRFKYLEYHKWRFDAEWYTQIVGNLVLLTSAKIGMLGLYDEEIGLSPFERFVLGGDGLAGQQFGLLGNDIISMRGYDTQHITSSSNGGAGVFDKFTVELRYALTTNPSSTIYVHVFAQGGNAWDRIGDFNPFDIKRSFGAGLRVFLPMFGTLGFDYGLGFDREDVAPGSPLTQYGTFNIVLGFEPD